MAELAMLPEVLFRMWWRLRRLLVVVEVVDDIVPLFIDPLFVFRFVPVVDWFCRSICDCVIPVVSIVELALVPLVPLTEVVLELAMEPLAIEPLMSPVVALGVPVIPLTEEPVVPVVAGVAFASAGAAVDCVGVAAVLP